ncbi:MAG: DNA alkylation repair protein [Actinomycetota bacterium]|nr:DNA alkylation repair protein [Actinomycetota bacterium]
MPRTDSPTDPGSALIDEVRAVLTAGADPERAIKQQAYMRSEMPYRGLSLPVLRLALRPLLTTHRLPDRADWEATVRRLWDQAEFREERYAAMTLIGHRLYAQWLPELATLPMLRHLVETGAWWDYTDEIAQKYVGAVLGANQATMKETMRCWAVDDHMWVRRTAILAQLGFRADTDRHLLLDCIEPNLADREFFIRKAIGWSLRQYARSGEAAADWVRGVVDGYRDRMSGLSRREALKHLG